MAEHHVTERWACRVLDVHRTAYRYQVILLPDEEDIRAKVIELVTSYGRIGYRMVTAMMNNAGIVINNKRVERIWREEGLKLPKKQAKDNGYGSTITAEFGCDRIIAITYGAMRFCGG